MTSPAWARWMHGRPARAIALLVVAGILAIPAACADAAAPHSLFLSPALAGEPAPAALAQHRAAHHHAGHRHHVPAPIDAPQPPPPPQSPPAPADRAEPVCDQDHTPRVTSMPATPDVASGWAALPPPALDLEALAPGEVLDTPSGTLVPWVTRPVAPPPRP